MEGTERLSHPLRRVIGVDRVEGRVTFGSRGKSANAVTQRRFPSNAAISYFSKTNGFIPWNPSTSKARNGLESRRPRTAACHNVSRVVNGGLQHREDQQDDVNGLGYRSSGAFSPTKTDYDEAACFGFKVQKENRERGSVLAPKFESGGRPGSNGKPLPFFLDPKNNLEGSSPEKPNAKKTVQFQSNTLQCGAGGHGYYRETIERKVGGSKYAGVIGEKQGMRGDLMENAMKYAQ